MNLGRFSTTKYSIPLFLIVISVAVIFLYWKGLSGPFLLDDYVNLEPMIHLSQGLINLEDFIFPSSSWLSSRPLSMFSFAASQYLSGMPFSFEDSNTFHFKALNLLIHFVIFLVILRLIYQLSLVTLDKSGALMLSVFTAVLWLTSPMWISTVLYVVQVMAQLSTLFCLLGCLTYLEARMRGQNFLAIVLALVCLGLAVLSKQNGVLLAPLIGLLEFYIYLYGSPQRSKSDRIFSFSVMGFVLFALTTAVCLVLFKSERFLHYGSYSFNLTERVFTELRVLCDYILSSILPFRGGSLFFDDFQVSNSLFQPFSTFISLVVLCTLLIVGVWALFRKKTALLGMGILFFFIGHGLESTVIPLELYFEHRNYLPAVGLYLAFAFLFSRLLIQKHRPIIYFVFLSYVGLNLFWLGVKAETWSSQEKLFTMEAQYHPNSLRLHKTLAVFFMNEHKIDRVAYHIEKVVDIYPGAAMGATIHLASAFCMLDVKPKNDAWVRHWEWENDEWEYVAGSLDTMANILSQKQCSIDIVAPLVYRLTEEINNWRLGPSARNIPSGVYMRMGHFALIVDAPEVAEEMSRIACKGTGGVLECLTLARVLVARGREEEASNIVSGLEHSMKWNQQIEAFREILPLSVEGN